LIVPVPVPSPLHDVPFQEEIERMLELMLVVKVPPAKSVPDELSETEYTGASKDADPTAPHAEPVHLAMRLVAVLPT